MEIGGCILIGILILVIAALILKIHLLQKAAREMEDGFTDRLMTDTNTLIDISSHDKHMRSLAAAMNIQLRKLRADRHRFVKGDMELKNAVTNISHDLRTPLTAICGYLELLEQEEQSEAVAHYLAIIRNRADMLTQLTEELFRYSVLSTSNNSPHPEKLVVNTVLEESIAASYTSLVERGIIPDIRIPEDKIERVVDKAALARLFSNLISNAIKYSDGDLTIVLALDGSITFRNTASGLNEVQVGKLFDRFYTVEAARNSTGLGLAIARTLIEQMQGSITADYDKGCLSIRITLPDNE